MRNEKKPGIYSAQNAVFRFSNKGGGYKVEIDMSSYGGTLRLSGRRATHYILQESPSKRPKREDSYKHGTETSSSGSQLEHSSILEMLAEDNVFHYGHASVFERSKTNRRGKDADLLSTSFLST